MNEPTADFKIDPFVQGYDLYHSPEFKAIADMLGIPLELQTVRLTIEIPADGTVKVLLEYYSTKREKKNGSTDQEVPSM